MSNLAWNDVDWTLVQQRVTRQQYRIYKASTERETLDTGNAKVRSLYRRVMVSLDVKLLAQLDELELIKKAETPEVWTDKYSFLQRKRWI